MLKKLAILLLVFSCSLLRAQTIKTDVLVIGGSPSGVAAAIQCANSKVKTVLAAESITINDNVNTNEMLTVDANSNIPSGTWGKFRELVHNFYSNTHGYDTAYNAPLKFELKDGNAILKKMTDTLKNLSLYLNSTFTSIKKDGDRWEVNITQDKKNITIKVRVIIDATANGAVALKTGAKLPEELSIYMLNKGPDSYRTAIATGTYLPEKGHKNTQYPPYPYWCIPINSVLLNDEDNLLITGKILAADKNMQYLPAQLELGQGAGTVAAYCAFFKTSTKNLKARVIQGELLDFKGYLLPFTDVSQRDLNWRAIQQVCATGLLKGSLQQNGNSTNFFFGPDSLVSTAEIRPVLTEIYTRAFLWFIREKPSEKFTVGNTISLISDYTLTDPEVLKTSLQKAWKTQYKFKLNFDLSRQITRREFAVLANRFLNPFARTVDLNGKLVN